jgi:hypothetical protein
LAYLFEFLIETETGGVLAMIIKGKLHGSALAFIRLWGLPVELPPTIALVL